MAGFSNYLEAAVINASLRGANLVAPATNTLHLAVFTADPTDDGNVNEVVGAWYARQACPSWAAPANGQTSNSNTITFPAVTGSGVTVTHFGIFDASSGGNMLYSAPLTTQKNLGVSDVLSFAPGSLVVTLD